MPFRRCLLWVAILASALGTSGVARAADIAISPPPTWQQAVVVEPADRWEARFGVFAHGVGTPEVGTVALNGEIVSPRLYRATGFWSFLIPRLALGGYVNTGGKTNIGYASVLWTIPVWDRFFVEAFTGPSVHDGSLVPAPGQSGLGCRWLFHSGASIGYRFSENLSVMANFSHLSNGRGVFGVNCGTNQGPGGNQGLNQYGVRLGYTF